MNLNAEINLTEAAKQKIAQLLAEEEPAEFYLRVYVEGGGCSGFQYGFAYEQAPEEEDLIIQGEVESKPVRVVVDSISYEYLEGAKIDYKQDVSGERFVIQNPNAQTTCGCGSSFAVAE